MQNWEFDYPGHRKSEIKQPIADVVLTVIGSPLRIDSRTASRSWVVGAVRVLPNATNRSSIRPRYTIRGPLPAGIKTAASGVTWTPVVLTSACCGSRKASTVYRYSLICWLMISADSLGSAYTNQNVTPL